MKFNAVKSRISYFSLVGLPNALFCADQKLTAVDSKIHVRQLGEGLCLSNGPNRRTSVLKWTEHEA